MKQQLLILFTAIFSLCSYAQISYEKGYFINNTNKKTSCLIKNVDWRINPTEIEYKLSENDKPKKASIDVIKEFGINNTSKYIKSTVNIDTSSENINKLSNERNPIFIEKELFLKVLVEGKFNLYEYQNKDLKFFYNSENSNIEQLVFKSYITNVDKIAKNYMFKQQLSNDLKCSEFKPNRINSVGYNKKDLIRFFTDYSNCNNTDLIDFEKKQKREFFNLTIRPRFNSSSMSAQHLLLIPNNYIDFENKTGIGFGLETEFVLPFNKNKWAFLIEPTYQNFKSEGGINNITSILGGEILTKIDYSSIEFNVGARHYFFLNDNSKIFINAAVIYDVVLKSSIELNRSDSSIGYLAEKVERTSDNFAFGLGYKLHDKYSIEMRLQTKREALLNLKTWVSDFKTISVIFGYTLF